MRSADWTRDRVHHPGNYGPSSVVTIKYKRREYRIVVSSGNGDDISVYREGSTVYILSRRDCMDYFGLERFDIEHAERQGTSVEIDGGRYWEPEEVIFLQSASEQTEADFRRPWREYVDLTLVRYALQWAQ